MLVENARLGRITQPSNKQLFKTAIGPSIASQANYVIERSRVGKKIMGADIFHDKNFGPWNGDVPMPSYHQL